MLTYQIESKLTKCMAFDVLNQNLNQCEALLPTLEATNKLKLSHIILQMTVFGKNVAAQQHVVNVVVLNVNIMVVVVVRC